nr:hypothetical protein [Tanacetum cinerariifolium]
MQTRSFSKLSRDQTANPTSFTNPTPKGRIRRSSKQEVENSNFEEHLTPVATMTDNHTMAEMLHQDSLNAAVGGNLLEKYPQDALTIIENKSKQTSDVTTAMTAMLKQLQANLPPAQVNVVEEICITCEAAGNYNQGNPGYRPQGVANQMRPPGSGSLPGNTVAKQKGELKAITTRSGLVTNGPTVSTPPKFVTPEEDECVEETYTDPDLAEYTIKQEKDEIQIQKFWQMFKQLHLNITLVEALVLMPKYQKMFKALLSNKEKLQELANTPLNENCSAVILKKLPEKLGDPGKFLIPCGYSELKCKALADLRASINLMPLSVWKKLGLPDLIPTRMTLELANRVIYTPDGIARDVFVPIGKFTFPADFVVVDYESDSRVPLILGRPFLRTARALIDVHSEKMILRDGDEILTLNMKHDTASYSNILIENHTTYSSNSLLEEFTNELALITYPPDYDDNLKCDIESDLKEIEFLLYQGEDSDLKDSIDQTDLAILDEYFVDPTPEMFTDEHALDYSFPPRFDVLPSSSDMALDALKGYILLYLSLFSIGNLCFPLNNFCLDVFEFFRCHFPLLNPFGVARVTNFVVACKACGGEVTVPLFSIPSIFIDGEEMAFQNFMKKLGESPYFSMRPANRHIDVGSPTVGPLTFVVDDDQVKSSSHLRDKGLMGRELMVVGESCSEQDVLVVEGSKKRHSITKALEEEATVVRPVSKRRRLKVLARYIRNMASGSDSLYTDVEEAHAAHNMISGLYYPLLKHKLGFLTFDELVDVYDVHALQMAVVRNMLMNESRILQLSKAQKNQDVEASQVVKDLRSENALNLEELLMLSRVAASSEESRKKLKSKEVSVLASQIEAAKLEKSKLVKDFLPLVVKKLFESEHFNQALVDLQQKAIMFGRCQALNEVHELGDFWDLKDVLPSSSDMALDALKGYILLYMSLFSIGNLCFPLNNFCFDVFEFFRCHFPLLNPFGVVRVTNFVVACKACGGGVTVPLFSIPSIFINGEEMAFQNFIKKLGESPSFSMRPANRYIDVGSPTVGPLTFVVDDDQVKSSSHLRDKGLMGRELVVVGESFSEQDVLVVEGSKKRHSITKALEEEATVVRPFSKRRRLKAQKNQDVKASQVVKDLRSENALNLEELSMLSRVAASSEESRKKLVEEMDSLQSPAKLEKSKLVKDFLPLVVKKLFESEHFNQALGDLQQKAIMFGRSQALNEVHELRDFWDLKDVQDYHPEAKKIFDEAAEAFYKLEFPYIFLLLLICWEDATNEVSDLFPSPSLRLHLCILLRLRGCSSIQHDSPHTSYVNLYTYEDWVYGGSFISDWVKYYFFDAHDFWRYHFGRLSESFYYYLGGQDFSGSFGVYEVIRFTFPIIVPTCSRTLRPSESRNSSIHLVSRKGLSSSFLRPLSGWEASSGGIFPMIGSSVIPEGHG